MRRTITKARAYAIGAVAQRTGVNIETIRYYERIGMMPKADRTPGGNRQYDHDQLKRLFFIKRSRELGFSLEEIRTLLSMVDGSGFTCAEIHALTRNHIAAVRRKITALKRMERTLLAMVAECDRGETPDCPIIDTLFEEASIAP